MALALTAPSPSTIRRARREVAASDALADAAIAFRRERGRRGDRELDQALARGADALLSDAFELGWWRDEGGSFAHYLLSFSLEWVWEELASGGTSVYPHPWRFRQPAEPRDVDGDRVRRPLLPARAATARARPQRARRA